MRNLLVLAVVAPLLATGCKKKEPEATVTAPPPAAATLGWTWGTAQYAGGHDAGNVGTLTYNLSIANPTESGLIVSAWDLGVTTDAGRLCVARGDELQKASAGNTLELGLKADCEYVKLPEADELPLKGTITYQLGGEPTTVQVDLTVKYAKN